MLGIIGEDESLDVAGWSDGMQTTSYGVIIGVDERRSGVRIKGRRKETSTV